MHHAHQHPNIPKEFHVKIEPGWIATMAVMAFLSGCGGGGGGEASSPSSSGMARAMSTNQPASTECPAGGARIDAGIDSNHNDVLDTSEITSTQYVCHGDTGLTTLVAMSPEAAGERCASGGTRVDAGADTSDDGVLDTGEVSSTAYVCDGAAAITWTAVTSTAVQAEPNKGYVATNNDQVTITLPTAPNVGDVVKVSGAGTGGWKIAQNEGQSIALGQLDVASAQRFDLTTVADNWTQASLPWQNWRSVASSSDGQRLVAAPYNGTIVRSSDAGVTWSSTGMNGNWTAVASSEEGSVVVVVGYSQGIYVSHNHGATWTRQVDSRPWTGVASSADGRVLVAVARYEPPYVSTDYGVTWTQSGGETGDWNAVAISADGNLLIAADNNGHLFISTDSGANWTYRGPTATWRAVASSADGTRLVAAVQNGQIYTSDDSGETWVAREQNRFWTSVSSSADGLQLVAVVGQDQDSAFTVPGFVYVSTDLGVTWTPHGPDNSWLSVASSTDGTRLVSATGNGISTSAPVRRTGTTTGTGGGVTGAQYQSIELQYLGEGQFLVLDSAGLGFGVQ